MTKETHGRSHRARLFGHIAVVYAFTREPMPGDKSVVEAFRRLPAAFRSFTPLPSIGLFPARAEAPYTFPSSGRAFHPVNSASTPWDNQLRTSVNGERPVLDAVFRAMDALMESPPPRHLIVLVDGPDRGSTCELGKLRTSLARRRKTVEIIVAGSAVADEFEELNKLGRLLQSDRERRMIELRLRTVNSDRFSRLRQLKFVGNVLSISV